MAAFPNRTQREKLEFAPIESYLNDVYELFVDQYLELLKAHCENGALKLQVAEKDQQMGSFADTAYQSI